MRLTDYDKLQLKLREYADRKAANGEIELANGILKAKCFIDQECEVIEEKQLTNRWIPVSEKLPEPRSKSYGDKQQRVEVIAFQRNGIVKEMLFEFSTQEFWEAGDTNPISHWQEDDIGYDTDVIAWQPLPEPWKDVSHG